MKQYTKKSDMFHIRNRNAYALALVATTDYALALHHTY